MMYQENTHPHACGSAQAAEALSARLDGELSAEENAALTAQLAACPACAAEAERLSRVRAAIADAEYTPPASLRAGVLAAIRREKRLRLIRKISTVGAVGAAAMLCVVIGIGFNGASDAEFAPMAGNHMADAVNAEPEKAEMADAAMFPAEEAPRALTAETDAVRGVWLPEGARSLPADVDLQAAFSADGVARLAEEQLGVLCIIETASDGSAPLVRDARDGRTLSLADFTGDALPALTQLLRVYGMQQAGVSAETRYRPTLAGLVLLTDAGEYLLPWDAAAVLSDCVARWHLTEAPLCAPVGSEPIA